mmetsp:Transcript_35996/g.35599  ORF Transcript_35996/g.35599 Transcript_35996/m.35599 type:complete len:92 (-) Transcript_35996:37-312(-)
MWPRTFRLWRLLGWKRTRCLNKSSNTKNSTLRLKGINRKFQTVIHKESLNKRILRAKILKILQANFGIDLFDKTQKFNKNIQPGTAKFNLK